MHGHIPAILKTGSLEKPHGTYSDTTKFYWVSMKVTVLLNMFQTFTYPDNYPGRTARNRKFLDKIYELLESDGNLVRMAMKLCDQRESHVPRRKRFLAIVCKLLVAKYILEEQTFNHALTKEAITLVDRCICMNQLLLEADQKSSAYTIHMVEHRLHEVLKSILENIS